MRMSAVASGETGESWKTFAQWLMKWEVATEGSVEVVPSGRVTPAMPEEREEGAKCQRVRVVEV